MGNTSANRTTEEKDPVDHPDGDVVAASSTAKLGKGFDEDNAKPNPFVTTDKPTPGGKAGKKTDKKPSSTAQKTSPVVASSVPITPRVRAVPRVSTDYNDSVAPRSFSLPAKPVYRASAPQSSRSSFQPSKPAESQLTSEQRRQNAIAATSFGGNGGTPSSSAQSASLDSQNSQDSQGGARGSTVTAITKSTAKEEYLAAEQAVIDGIPQTEILRAKVAKAKLLQGLAFTLGDQQSLEGQEVVAEVVDPLDSGLPVGSQVNCAIQFPPIQGQVKNAVVHLNPISITLNGYEYDIPQKTAVLTNKNGKPLIAKRGGSEFLRFLSSATKTFIGAGTGILTSLTGFWRWKTSFLR
ncbi:MAG: hypothetical protein HC852_23485 [Acaryochloridaceae cyanobacterium RU_4_10]|nr:hypothetical protein [Acaryochloridaceae cyanobacterium RU_4_10]